MKNLKKRLQNGELLHGSWLNLGSPISAEIVGKMGYDWALIDLEHAPGTENEAISQMQALAASATAGLVRVENGARLRISRILDLGAEGIMVPQVKTLAEVKQAIQSMHYPPHGIRGIATMTRATNFGASIEEYIHHTWEQLIGIIQIETTEILDHLDEVAGMEGVDVLFLGPADLSLNLGIFLQFDHPLFQKTLKAISEAALNAGKALGVLIPDMERYDMYYDLGFRFIAVGADSGHIIRGSRELIGKLNAKKS